MHNTVCVITKNIAGERVINDFNIWILFLGSTEAVAGIAG